jgi:hypothetical protein
VDGEVLTIAIESSSTQDRHGIWLRTDRGISVAGQLCPSVDLWADTAPAIVSLQCHTSNGSLSFYNIWERRGRRNSQSESSGMLVTELRDGWRYHCNDFGFDSAFDKLVFRVERDIGPNKPVQPTPACPPRG